MSSSFVFRTPSEIENEANQSTTKTHSATIIASGYAGTDLRRGVTGTGPGSRYLERGIRFYQLFNLNVDLGLWTTLCSTSSPLNNRSAKHETIRAPTVKETKKFARFRSTVEADPFLVPDELDDDDSDLYHERSLHPPNYKQTRGRGQSRPYSMDYSSVFKHLFPEAIDDEITADGSPELIPEDLSGFIQALPQRIEDWKERGNHTRITL